MATAVASGCTSCCGSGGAAGSSSGGGLSTSSPQDKGQSNKRKLPSEGPALDASSTPSLYSFYAPAYETGCHPSDDTGGCEVSNAYSLVKHSADGCEICTSLTSPRDGPGIDEIEDADWNDPTETELKEILLSHIGTLIDEYIRKIVSLGYTEDDAMKAVMKAGVSYGGSDPVSCIMDSALELLKDDHGAASANESTIESLDHLELHILEAMVFALREVRPFFSYGDAMWLLLVCDLDIANACQINVDHSVGPGSIDTTHSPSAQITNQNSTNSSSASSKPDPSSNSTTDPLRNTNFDFSQFYSKALSRPVDVLPSDIPLDVEIPKLLAEWSSSLSNNHMRKPGPISGKGRSTSLSVHTSGGPSYAAPSYSNSSDEKSCTIKKNQRGNLKKNSVMLQKTILFEKHYTAYGPKGAMRAGKFSGLGSLFLDKKCKSSSSRINMKGSSIKISKSIKMDASQEDAVSTFPFTEEKCTPPNSEEKKCSSPFLTGDSDSSIPFSSESGNSSVPADHIHNSGTDTAKHSTSVLTDKMAGSWVPRDKKDEFLLKLNTRAEELRLQLEEWTEWAQQKVMQAARRLNKDKAEIQALRHEKEEAERVIRERQNLEQSSMKKLSEIESALLKADCQQAWASGAKCRLEIENTTLREEMEAAKLQATESASNCVALSRREITAAQNSQLCDQQKQLFKDEIIAEKHKLSQLQKQLDEALKNQCRLEDRWKREQKVKDEVRSLANSLVWEREQIEATAKSKEDLIRLADGGLQKRIDDVQRLENHIKQLKENLRSSTNSLVWSGSEQLNLGCLPDFTDLQLDWDGDLRRDHECVMCMVVEKSVVFLPCGHQVVCIECNKLHEKQGMKDCPSCRTTIQRRIPARFRGAL